MRLAYLDCFAGISGSMVLAALLHAGADLDPIAESLAALPTAGYVVEREDVDAMGIPAVRLHVKTRPGEVIWTYASIRSMLQDAELPDEARQTALRAFRLLADADGRIHDREADLVTFYESGEPDVIVPIVGTALALHQLEVDRVFASPVPTGLGMVRTEHGVMPVPSPVVIELLTGVPTYSKGIAADLVTPVGAAILAAIAEGYGEIPLMRPEAVGYGAGDLRLDFPNVLRVVIGEGEPGSPQGLPGEEVVLQGRMHELGPQAVPALLSELLAAGAADAWLTPIVGLDGEPAVMVYAVAGRQARAAVRRTMESRGAAEIRALAVRPL